MDKQLIDASKVIKDQSVKLGIVMTTLRRLKRTLDEKPASNIEIAQMIDRCFQEMDNYEAGRSENSQRG